MDQLADMRRTMEEANDDVLSKKEAVNVEVKTK